ncbi:LPXTG cell wall anchor domain-containing protein [Streptomyces sp. CAI 127]|uniref:LPXTG cell wall anchor domain-containing protein n=1 Tax=Streptomyces sp. CAI 127 TaxID=1076397 RepID=UPI001587CD08|nr:LPXTG cell wall anchor domain-containing protein [Streptomyces sp. CAI 127]NUW02867.1 LPXTG cell wall anchor domain-containing protein [Streptomyces sp. CAI 127]
MTTEGNVVTAEAPQSPPTSDGAPSGLPVDEASAAPTPHPSEPKQTGVPAVQPEASGTGRESAPAKSAPAAISPGSNEEEEPEEEEEEPEEELCVDHPDRDAVRATLQGLPDRIVPGSGWHNFTLRISNTSARSMKSVFVYVMKDMYSPIEDVKNLEHLMALEWYDQDTGTWEVAEPYYGHVFDLSGMPANENVVINLRIKVHAKPVSGIGAVTVAAEYRDENDLCGRTTGDDDSGGTDYNFAVGDKSSGPPDTGTPVESEKPATPRPISSEKPAAPSPTPQETRKDVGAEASVAGPTARPSYETGTPSSPAASSGSLARTGSSATTWLLGAGCISVALGSGLAVAARRRRNHI